MENKEIKGIIHSIESFGSVDGPGCGKTLKMHIFLTMGWEQMFFSFLLQYFIS